MSFLASRSLSYSDGVIGLAGGALVWALTSVLYALRVMRRIDFYYYSAF